MKMTPQELAQQTSKLVEETCFNFKDTTKIVYHTFAIMWYNMKRQKALRKAEAHAAKYNQFVQIANFSKQLDRDL